MSTYVMGLLLGYVIANKIEVKSRIQSHLIASITLFSPLCAIYLGDNEHNARFNILGVIIDFAPLIAPIAKLLFMCFWSGLSYMLWNGKLRLLRTFMDSRLIQVLGKISYSTFMVHFLLIWYQNANARYQRDFYLVHFLNEVVAHFCLAHLLGYLLFLLIESPAANLLKKLK